MLSPLTAISGRFRAILAPVAATASLTSDLDTADPVPDRSAWSARVRSEAARVGRYERAAAIVVIRLEAFSELVAAAGAIDGGRLCRAVVASLRRSARDSDIVFGERSGTFRILLGETDETGAGAFVDRASEALRPWIEASPKDVHLTAAWASTSELTDLPAAERLADARLVGAEDGWIRSAFIRRG